MGRHTLRCQIGGTLHQRTRKDCRRSDRCNGAVWALTGRSVVPGVGDYAQAPGLHNGTGLEKPAARSADSCDSIELNRGKVPANEESRSDCSGPGCLCGSERSTLNVELLGMERGVAFDENVLAHQLLEFVEPRSVVLLENFDRFGIDAQQ